MADIKVTGLSAVTPPIDKGSLVLSSVYDGVSAYTSEKVTVSELADAVFLMDAEQKITFDSSGTNKDFFQATDNNATIWNIADNGLGATNVLALTADSSGFTQGWGGVSSQYAAIGHGSGATVKSGQFLPNYGFAGLIDKSFMLANDAIRIEADATGLGFFATTPVAKPTSVAVSAAGIHAALTSLGLIS